MKIKAIEASKRRHQEQGSFLMNAVPADFPASTLWHRSELAHLIDAATSSPQQQGGVA
ncbi:MAG: hypothetical protein QM796_01440 [Chthoniobacteraceae bacterium]